MDLTRGISHPSLRRGLTPVDQRVNRGRGLTAFAVRRNGHKSVIDFRLRVLPSTVIGIVTIISDRSAAVGIGRLRLAGRFTTRPLFIIVATIDRPLRRQLEVDLKRDRDHPIDLNQPCLNSPHKKTAIGKRFKL